jgi:hypothetical protein
MHVVRCRHGRMHVLDAGQRERAPVLPLRLPRLPLAHLPLPVNIPSPLSSLSGSSLHLAFVFVSRYVSQIVTGSTPHTEANPTHSTSL